MAKTHSIVEINGNRYNAVTGQILDTTKKVAGSANNMPVGVIDGFTRHASGPTSLVPISKSLPLKSSGPKLHVNKKRQDQPAHAVHKRTQRSRALMRGVVTKPKSLEATEKNQHIIPAKRLPAADYDRASRAKTIVTHTSIKRFGTHAQQTSSSKSSGAPRHKVSSAAMHAQSSQAFSPVRAVPAVIGNLSSQQLERLLDQALTKADAHKNGSSTRLKKAGLWQRVKRAPSWRSLGAGTAAVLVLGGFFAWQNIPQLSMKMAASRANISASVPGYTPSGFRFAGPISYSNGAVSINFKANSDNIRSFTLVQQKSSWDSQALAANTLPANSQVQTSQVNGKTVYIYGPANNATWVDSGVRYTLTDRASLTSDQILKIAGSL